MNVMRIVSWNCNGAFRNKYELIAGYQPDIIVAPESESPEFLAKSEQNIPCENHIWDGESACRGLSIFTFNGYKAYVPDFYRRDFKMVMPVMVYNAWRCYLLIAVWTKFVGKVNNSYVAQAYNAMCFYDKYFTGNTVIIGDFNSNAIWDNKKQRRVKHQALVRKLSNDNFSSVYHEMNDEQQGHETQPTLFFHHQKEKAYHIDYAFMHRSMFDNLADFRVGKHEEWGQKSDHMPLFLNLKDRAC